jgi:hypothetical protein
MLLYGDTEGERIDYWRLEKVRGRRGRGRLDYRYVSNGFCLENCF